MRPRTTQIAMLLAMLGAAAGQAAAMQRSAPQDEQAVVDELFDSIELAPMPDEEVHTTDRSSSTYSMIGDNKRVIVRIVDGKVSCEVNGKKVDPDRVKKEADRIIVLGDDDEKIAVFRIAGHGGSAPTGSTLRRGVPLQWRSGAEAGVLAPMPPKAPAASPPDVMVGLMMGEPGESLLQHFGLKPGEAILVTNAIEGLPAHKAGINAGDLIVAIDGDAPASPAKLHEALSDLDAGDTLRLHVIQKGQKHEIKVKVAAYDADALSVNDEVEFDVAAPEDFRFDWRDAQGLRLDNERLRQRAEELAERLREHGGRGAQDMDTIRKYFEELAESNAGRQSEMRLRVEPQIGERLQNLMVPRGLGGEWQGELEERLEQLHAELDHLSAELEQRLEDRLSRLEGMIDKLVTKLESDTNRQRGSRDRDN